MTAKSIMRNIIIVMVIFAGLLACQNTSPPTVESFYKRMTQENIIESYGFPEALKSIEGERTGTILANEKDTLKLISCYPNMADKENRYPQYLLADNHNNWWTLTREGDLYKLYNHSLVVPQKNWVRPFCATGVFFVAWFLIILLFATDAIKKMSVNDIIKLTILAFVLGGFVGIALFL